MPYANQLKVKVMPKAKRDKDHIYSMFNIDALQLAMNNLKGESFKLWVYLNKNQDNYEFDLSQAACAQWGLKKDAYQSAKKTLMKLGYLIEGAESLEFYETPQLNNLENRQSEKPILNSQSEKPTVEQSEKPTVTLIDRSEKPINESVFQINRSEKPYTNNIIIQDSTENITIHGDITRYDLEHILLPESYEYVSEEIIKTKANKYFKIIE